MRTTTTLILLVALLVASGTALAAGEATAEKKKDGEGLAAVWNSGVGVGIVTAVILLFTLPFATLLRARFSLVLRAAEATESRPYVTVLLGAANVLLVVLVAAASSAVPVIGIVALLLVIALFVGMIFGLCGVAVGLGRRLFRDEGRGESVGAFVLAWLVLSGLALLPWIGFFYLLWLASRGIGAFLLSLYVRSVPAAEEASGG